MNHHCTETNIKWTFQSVINELNCFTMTDSILSYKSVSFHVWYTITTQVFPLASFPCMHACTRTHTLWPWIWHSFIPCTYNFPNGHFKHCKKPCPWQPHWEKSGGRGGGGGQNFCAWPDPEVCTLAAASPTVGLYVCVCVCGGGGGGDGTVESNNRV